MSKTRISNHLLIVRRRVGLTRKQVGTALGLSNSTVSRYEQGRQIPSLKTLLQLELLFRMPIAYLYQEFYAELRDGMRQPPSNPVSSEHTAAAQEVNHA